MRKSLLLTILLALLLVGSALAYDVGVSSASSDEVEIYFSGLETVDVVFDNIQVVVETDFVNDRYLADYRLDVQDGTIYLLADLSEVFEDYSLDEVMSIIISGELDGEDFAKRVAVRGKNGIQFGAPKQAPGKARFVYWVITVVLIIVVTALLILLAYDSKHMRKQRAITRKSSAKKVSKKKSKKKTAKKKSSKKKASKKKKVKKRSRS